MTISPRTTKMLWGRSSGLCSICRKELVVENTGADAEALIGDMCHMVAESEDGPRGQSALTSEQRDRYENLILLCRNHHAEIDGQPATFPVKRLKTIKAEHEQWVRELWSYDSVQQQDDENCAGYIEEWVRRCDLDGWINWSSFVLGGGQPRIMVEQDRALEELRSWLLGRIWPTRYPTLRRAFANFRAVLEDFQRAFRQQADQPSTDSEWLITQKFYQITEWDEEQYERLHKSYASHVALVSDLMLELTRAANLICGEVRSLIIPDFRLSQGHIMVQSGPHQVGDYRTFAVFYKPEEMIDPMPYPGLEEFKEVRFSRDRYFGRRCDYA